VRPLGKFMSKSIARLLSFVVLAALCLGGTGFAQDQEAARLEAERIAREAAAARAAEIRAAEAERRERERLDASMRDFLKDSREVIATANGGTERYREVLLRAEYQQLRTAFQAYQAAREELSAAVSFKARLKEPAKKIEKSANAFLDFIKRRHEKRQRFEPKEFKDFTASELNWEALTTVERLAPQLAAVIQSQNAASVEVEFLLSLAKLETELLRLKWMLGKLK
jgi:hypothetical protein